MEPAHRLSSPGVNPDAHGRGLELWSQGLGSHSGPTAYSQGPLANHVHLLDPSFSKFEGRLWETLLRGFKFTGALGAWPAPRPCATRSGHTAPAPDG